MVIKVKALTWDAENKFHINKHDVSCGEVEEVCGGIYKQQPTYNNRYLIFGKTKNNRLLTVVLARERRGVYYVVTARDMSKKERRRFIYEEK